MLWRQNTERYLEDSLHWHGDKMLAGSQMIKHGYTHSLIKLFIGNIRVKKQLFIMEVIMEDHLMISISQMIFHNQINALHILGIHLSHQKV